MKKKKQRKDTSDVTVSGTVEKSHDDLESIIHSHGEFFNLLIESIPAKFYLPNEDADSKPWYPGIRKSVKAKLKEQSKENHKIARRQRFDPDKEQISTLDLLEQQTKEKGTDNVGNGDTSVTYEELQEKLRRRIESLKGNRGEKKVDAKKASNDFRKRKRDVDNGGGGENSGAGSRGDVNEEENIEYGKVRLGDENEGTRKKKKKILSKEKELQKAKMLAEVKKENPYVANRESWKAAANRAGGIKVHDDARLIKDSMRRKKKRKEKSAEMWKGRVETQEKKKKERQDKRKQNITARINDKKMRKIAKREKKLMRPGFEGRKEGYITNE